MKTRIAAVAVILSLALGVTAAVVLGASVIGHVDEPRTAGSVQLVSHADTPIQLATSPQPVEERPLPTEADIPADWSAEERANAVLWLESQRITDECMAGAGFDEYTYRGYWDNDARPFALQAVFPWAETEEERVAAATALYGDTAAAADYHWEDAGCAGLAAHQTGSGT